MTWLPPSPDLEVHPIHLRLVRLDPSHRWSFLAAPATKSAELCGVQGCRKTRRPRSKSCERCAKLRMRTNNPLFYQFNNLRDSARKKRIPFQLTRAEFETFAIESGYLDGCGREVGCLHVDRRNPLEGYHVGNIRALESGENSRKGASEDKKTHWLERRRNGGHEVFEQRVFALADPEDPGF